MIIIITIKEMGDEDWFVGEILGLSISCTIGTAGYIYLSKTRCGTEKMWKDYFTRVVIPTIKKSNDFYKAKEILNIRI